MNKIKIKKTIIFIMLLMLTNVSCKQTKEINSNIPGNDLFRIKSISEKKHVYIIYAERNDSVFKILSERNEYNRNIECAKIKTNKYYKLEIRATLPSRSIASGLAVSQLSYNGLIIKVEKKSHNTLYVVDNLDGLCLKLEQEGNAR